MFEWGFKQDGRVYVLHVIIGQEDMEIYCREAANMTKLTKELADFLKQNDGDMTRHELDELSFNYHFLTHMSIYSFKYVVCYRVAMNMYVGDIKNEDELSEYRFILTAMDHDPKPKEETSVLIHNMNKVNRLMHSVRTRLRYSNFTEDDKNFVKECIDKAYTLSNLG